MTNIVEVGAWSYLSFPHKMDPMKTTSCLKNIYYFKKKKKIIPISSFPDPTNCGFSASEVPG